MGTSGKAPKYKALKIRLLFICSRNLWRSRTAEHIFKNHGEVDVRSAGTSAQARIRVQAAHLEWAELVLVMENKHKKYILDQFPHVARQREIWVLDIPDEYEFLDPELVEMLEKVVEEVLDFED